MLRRCSRNSQAVFRKAFHKLGPRHPRDFDAIGEHLLAGSFFAPYHGQDYPTNPFITGNDTSVSLSRLAVERLGKAWAEVAPDVAFSAQTASNIFADDSCSDKSHSALFDIGIASLGLYGLSTLNVSRRCQEIGIRTVLGADT